MVNADREGERATGSKTVAAGSVLGAGQWSAQINTEGLAD